MEHLTPREWKDRAGVSPGVSDEIMAELQAETGLSAVTLRVCVSRGLTSAQAIQDFLHPKFEKLSNPLSILDMEKAVARLSLAREKQELVRIFGDYDVDGTTGTALLSWIFRDFGLRFDARQPDRFKDGYGMSRKAVEEAHEAGVRILVTVDNGISCFDAADRAAELGIDLIIVDHHLLDPARGVPKAYAVLNPQRPDCESGLKQLCGCGLAFYLALALRAHGRKEGWFEGRQEPNLKQHLDLVVMATAADMVPLTGDNHVLVRHGLEVLKVSKKPGVKALLEVAGVGSRDLNPGHLGFVIGPRINASGRMQSASLALELLTTSDTDTAYRLARELERLNQERAEVQNQIWDEVRKRVEDGLADGRFKNAVVVADANWHEGVVGIVASRVTETFRKPAVVIALREDMGKGSVRSFGGKDVLAALRQCSEHLKGFGGHKHAAGVSIARSDTALTGLAEAFDRAVGELPNDSTAKALLIEGSCTIEDLDHRTLEELEKLGPFGPGNPEPVFAIKAGVRNHHVIKGRHLKFSLTHAAGIATDRPSSIDAIWFHAAEREGIIAEALTGVSEWAGVPELNRFRGNATPTLRVRDWRKISPPVV